MTNTQRVQRVTAITPADKSRAAHRALTAAAAKVRITQGQRQTIAASKVKAAAPARRRGR